MPGEIVYDSILANKERTKSYWERLMVAAQGRPQRPADPAQPISSRGDGDSYSHFRSSSFDSMSSGNSSTSESAPVRKWSWPRLKDDNLQPSVGLKETPIEKEIRLVKEREEELKLEKLNCSLQPLHSTDRKKIVEVRKASYVNGSPVIDAKPKQPTPSSSPESCENEVDSPHPKIALHTSPKRSEIPDDIKAELESISLKKCVSMSNLPMTLKNESDSSGNTNNRLKVNSNMKHFRMQSSRQSLTNVAAPKLFIPSKCQKGLMKRFLESHGRMVSKFTLAQPSLANSANGKNWSSENLLKSVDRTQLSGSLDDIINLTLLTVPNTLSLHANTSYYKEKSQSSSKDDFVPTVQSRRPGYISAEDKIQMELKEMKQREAELKKERARLLGRSQPNLQKLEDCDSKYSDKEEETVKLPTMGKLRSALSNPNLVVSKPPIQKAPVKKRSALIDAWESRIRSTQ